MTAPPEFPWEESISPEFSLPPELREPQPGPILQGANALLSRWAPALIVQMSVAMVIALGIIQYSLGPELGFSAFYLLPISATAWYGLGRSGTFVCALAATVALGADAFRQVGLLPGWVITWNLGVQLTVFVGVAALVTWLRQAKEVQRLLALSDPLTGLANTRAFFDRLQEEIDRGLRYGRVFTLLYMDLDRFKEVNDTLGHAEGDQVLVKVANTLRTALRTSDLPARLGGDEFGVILPETAYAKAEQAIEKLRGEILSVMRDEGWPVTLSIGAVTFETPAATADDAARLADGLMYAVKDGGGDGIQHLLWSGG